MKAMAIMRIHMTTTDCAEPASAMHCCLYTGLYHAIAYCWHSQRMCAAMHAPPAYGEYHTAMLLQVIHSTHQHTAVSNGLHIRNLRYYEYWLCSSCCS